jgi:hypothetical protein
MKRLFLIAAALLALTSVTSATGPDDCAVVSKTPDGFLNVRKAPTMKSEIIVKIHPGDLVYADAYECQITDNCGNRRLDSQSAAFSDRADKNCGDGWAVDF